MPKSKIIKDLVNEDVDLEIALNRLFVLAKDVDDNKLADWADKELRGYSKDDTLPEYRKTVLYNMEYSGINGSFSVKNSKLDFSFLEAEDVEKVSNIHVKNGIKAIKEFAKSPTGAIIDYSYLAGGIFDKTGGQVQCTSINQVIPSTFFINVLSEVKSMVIKALIELEKEYGNLDELAIDSNKTSKSGSLTNNQIVNNVVVEGRAKENEPWYSKIAWKIIVPIATAVIGGLVTHFADGLFFG